MPPGTEGISIQTRDGVELRGVFVPAGDGAPVVLHLLEATATAADSRDVFARLSEYGIASLCCDWRGVGLSDGSRNSRRLGEDALSMYEEAVRRAGGESRVAVRGASLGTLGEAYLLHCGRRPAATAFFAPIEADNAVSNYVHEFYGSSAAFLVRLVFRDILDVAVGEAIANAPTRCLVVLPRSDLFVRDEEIDRLATLARRNDHIVLRDSDDHVACVQFSRSLSAVERNLLFAAFQIAPPSRGPITLRRRFESARLRAALERKGPFASEFEEALVARWLSHIPARELDAMPDDAIDALLDLHDPAGDLDLAEMSFIGTFGRGARVYAVEGRVLDSVLATAKYFASRDEIDFSVEDPRGVDIERSIPFGVEWTNVADLHRPPPRSRLCPEDSRRQVLRLTLKGAGIPDRVVKDQDGTYAVEIFWEGRWQRQDDRSRSGQGPETERGPRLRSEASHANFSG